MKGRPITPSEMPKAPPVPEIVFETINGFITCGWIATAGRSLIDRKNLCDALGSADRHLDNALEQYTRDWIVVQDGWFLHFHPRPASDDGEK